MKRQRLFSRNSLHKAFAERGAYNEALSWEKQSSRPTRLFYSPGSCCTLLHFPPLCCCIVPCNDVLWCIPMVPSEYAEVPKELYESRLRIAGLKVISKLSFQNLFIIMCCFPLFYALLRQKHGGIMAVVWRKSSTWYFPWPNHKITI